MGDSNGSGGESGTGPYLNALSPVACTYSPEPAYTDEARKLKLQGNITVSVLVGVDGRAQKIRIVKGLAKAWTSKPSPPSAPGVSLPPSTLITTPCPSGLPLRALSV